MERNTQADNVGDKTMDVTLGPFSVNDWRNMLDAVCRWQPEEWGYSSVGARQDALLATKSECEESG